MKAVKRSNWKYIAPAAILIAGIAFQPRPVSAKPEYTRRLKKGCDVCHPPDSRELNEAGEYYRSHKSLDGYKPKEQSKPKESANSNRSK
jgi:hypothetical protein